MTTADNRGRSAMVGHRGDTGQVSTTPFWQQQTNAAALCSALLDSSLMWMWAWSTSWSVPCHDDWSGHA